MSYDSTILAEVGLLAYWPLNDSASPAADATGNSHSLTLASGVTTGAASLLPADTETALTWGNTVAAESTVASPTALNVTTFSVEFWVNFSALSTGKVHLVSVNGTSGGFGAGYDGVAGHFLFTTYGHADNEFSTAATPAISTLYHLVYTLDGTGNLKLYINGSLAQTITSVGISSVSASTACEIGGRSSDSDFLKGVLQKVAIYNTPLTGTQVSTHYSAGIDLFGTATLGSAPGGIVASANGLVFGTAVVGSAAGGVAPGGGSLKASVPYYRGVADSGPEFGGTFPGTFGVDYSYDGLATLQYLAGRGHKIIRLPISWERIQPTRASVGTSTLDATQLGYITTYLANAATAGLKVIIDIHNYCRYITPTGTTLVMYTDFPDTDLVDLWTKLSTALKGNSAVYAYEIMNEPHDLPAQTFPLVPTSTVADFDTVGTTITNWVTNGGEAGTFALSTAQAHDGTHSLAFTPTSWAASGFDDVRLWDKQNTYTNPGTNGTISVWVYVPSSAGTSLQAYLALVTQSGAEDKSATVGITANTWTQLTWTPAAASWTGNQGIRIQMSATAAGGSPTFYVDTIQVGTKVPDIPGSARWHTTSQSVLDAIRANSDNTCIYVDGYQFASASFWVSNGNTTPWLTDSAENVRYVAHHYCGVNLNGNFLTFATETSDAQSAGYASLADQAVQRLQVFTNWLRANGVRGAVTEIAWRGDESSASWNAVGEAMYEELDNADCDVTYWATGNGWVLLSTGTAPGFYIAYNSVDGSFSSPVSIANPQATTIEAHPSVISRGTAGVADAGHGIATISDSIV